MQKFGGYAKKQYLCTVFFMVLDLRLSKDWVVGRQSSFFCKNSSMTRDSSFARLN